MTYHHTYGLSDILSSMTRFYGPDNDDEGIPELYMKTNKTEFAKFIIELPEILIEGNFDALENSFSENFWNAQSAFMEQVLHVEEYNALSF